MKFVQKRIQKPDLPLKTHRQLKTIEKITKIQKTQRDIFLNKIKNGKTLSN